MTKEPIKLIVLHCSDTPTGRNVDISDVRKWHTDKPPKGRGWKDVGYHFFIKIDGTIQTGRVENGDGFLEASEMGAHVHGHNKNSIGICYAGRTGMNIAQEKAALYWLSVMLRHLNLPISAVQGHREVDPSSGKTCPGISMDAFRRKLKKFMETKP